MGKKEYLRELVDLLGIVRAGFVEINALAKADPSALSERKSP